MEETRTLQSINKQKNYKFTSHCDPAQATV